jgi:SAM-dependent methyltransferase
MCQLLDHANRENSEAEAWDRGCRQDSVRNEFIVPLLAAVLRNEQSSRILDVGTGTGHIPRAVDQLLVHRPEWTLVDLDKERLAFASRLQPAQMKMHAIQGDIANLCGKVAPFDATMMTFTLLEAADCNLLLSSTGNLTRPGGLRLIAVPDTWRDVLATAEETLDPAWSLLSGTVEMAKTDKFTGAPYPFHALRTELLIRMILHLGFTLERLEWGGPSNEAFFLAFRKRRAAAHEAS